MSILAWESAEEYLKMRLEHSRSILEDFQGTEFERGRLAGEVRTLKEMLRLPQTLALLDAHDKEVRESA